MANTSKTLSGLDESSSIRQSHNPSLGTLTVEGFVASKVGHKITVTIGTTTVANDTETLNYYDSGTLICTIVSVYTDGNRTVLSTVERTA